MNISNHQSSLRILILTLIILTPSLMIAYKLSEPGISHELIDYSGIVKGQLKHLELEASKTTNEKKIIFNLQVHQAETLTKNQIIYFKIGTYSLTPLIKEAYFLIGANCKYSTKESFKLKDNEWIAFNKEGKCLEKNPTQAALHFTTDNIQKLAIWGIKFSSPNGLTTLPMINKETSKSQIFMPLFKTSYIYNLPSKSIWELLKYMWAEIGESGFLFITAIGAIVALLLGTQLIGPYLFRIISNQNSIVDNSFYSNLRGVFGVFLIYLGLSLAFCVFTPPFQAADEPDHILGFGLAVGVKDYKKKSLEFSARDHFARIRQVPWEKFRIQDVNNPGENSWNNRFRTSIHPVHITARSPVTNYIWKTVNRWFNLASSPIATQVMILRLSNALLTSLSFLFLAFCFARQRGLNQLKLTALLSVLILPTLPYFSMFVSNYPALISILYIQIGLCLFTIPKKKLFGYVLRALILGFFSVTYLNVGKVAIFSVVPVFFLLLSAYPKTRMLYKIIGQTIYLISIAIFLAIFGLPRELPTKQIMTAINKLIESFGFDLTTFLTIVVTFLTLLIYGLRRFCLGEFYKNGIKKLEKIPPRSLLIGIMFFICSYLFVLPKLVGQLTLQDIEISKKGVSALQYVFSVIKIFLLSPSPFVDDFYIASSLWMGFGWLDVFFSTYLFSLIKAVPFLLFFGLLYESIKNRQVKIVFSKVASGVFLLILVLAVQAYANYQRSINLHGRYLLPIMIYVISFIFFIINSAKHEINSKYQRLVLVILGLFLSLCYYSTFCSLIERYF